MLKKTILLFFPLFLLSRGLLAEIKNISQAINGVIKLVTTDPQGNILVGGDSFSQPSLGKKFFLSRFKPNGDADLSFGDGSFIISRLYSRLDDEKILSLALDGNGILVVGIAGPTSYQNKIFLARFLSTGELDKSYGGGKGFVEDLYRGDGIYTFDKVAFDGKGTVILAGDVTDAKEDVGVSIMGYLTQGIRNTDFGAEGLVNTNIDYFSDDYSSSVVFDPLGRILIGGYSVKKEKTDANQNYHSEPLFKIIEKAPPPSRLTGNRNSIFTPKIKTKVSMPVPKIFPHLRDFTLFRYTPEGQLDKSFGKEGIVKIDLGKYDQAITNVALDRSGKIFAAGNVHGDPIIFRFNENGVLDKGFGGGSGYVIPDFGLFEETSSMEIDKDGNILLLLSFQDKAQVGKSKGVVLARFKPDGELDMGFGQGKGFIRLTEGEDSLFPQALAIDSAGNILTGITRWHGALKKMVLLRYNQNGDLNKTFGEEGSIF